MTAILADRFVAQLTPAAVEVLVVLCCHAPERTYEALQADVQAHLGISRNQLGGVLTSLAGAGKRLPLDLDYPIKHDRDLRRYRIEPDAADYCWVSIAVGRWRRVGVSRSPLLGGRRLSTSPPGQRGHRHGQTDGNQQQR